MNQPLIRTLADIGKKPGTSRPAVEHLEQLARNTALPSWSGFSPCWWAMGGCS